MTPVDWAVERRHQNSILKRFLLKTSWLVSFTFVTFLIHWTLSPAASSVSWCRSCFVCSWLEIYGGGSPSTYIYCMVCYRVIAAVYVISVVIFLHTITLLIMIQWTMNSLNSLKFATFITIIMHLPMWIHKGTQTYTWASDREMFVGQNPHPGMNILYQSPLLFIPLLNVRIMLESIAIVRGSCFIRYITLRILWIAWPMGIYFDQ